MLCGLVGVVGRDHAPGLLPPGDGDQGAPGDRPVPPPRVPDLLGQPREAQGLADGVLGLPDDAAELFLGVALLVHEALQGLGLLDAGQILALEVLDKGDLRMVPGHADGGQDQEARRLGRQVARSPETM